VDVYPTLLSAAGIEIPEYAIGEDLIKESGTRSANFCGLHERADEAAFMWRTPEYKLILRMERKVDASAYTSSDVIGGEFYNLVKDPNEWNDLYGHGDIVEKQLEMTGELLVHLKSLKQVPPLDAAI
jgi:arylsulfatase A-like enzyme